MALNNRVDTEALRMAYRSSRMSSHWEGCVTAHAVCALLAALDEIDMLRRRLLGEKKENRVDQKEAMRLHFVDGLSRAAIARKYGVSRQYIGYIVKRAGGV